MNAAGSERIDSAGEQDITGDARDVIVRYRIEFCHRTALSLGRQLALRVRDNWQQALRLAPG
jgi:hypothetical protein